MTSRIRTRATASLFVIAAVASSPPVEVEAQTSVRPEVVSLDFRGNASVPDRTLANSILTRQSTCRSFILQPFCWADREFAMDRAYLNPRTFREDYVRLHLLYRQRGFRDAQIDTVVNRIGEERAELMFLIQEGEPHRIASIEVRGLEGLDDPDIGSLPVAPGDRLDLPVLDAARDTITRRLRNRGYAHVDVLRDLFIPAGTREAEIAFDVYPGPRARFGAIEVVGNEQVEDNVIRRMLPFDEGSVYSQELLFDAQRNVYSLEIFRHASITQDLTHEPDSVVPLRVQVNEGNPHRVRAGGGWTTAECFTAESRWASRNFFGGARRLVVRGGVSNLLTHTLDDTYVCSGAGTGVYADLNWGVSADFTQPFLLSPRNTFSASVFAEKQSLPDVFVREGFGLTLSLTRSIGRGTPLTLSYRPQLARLDATETFFCTSVLVCDPVDIDVLQASNWLAPVGLSFSRDRTDRAVSPRAGYRLLADADVAAPWTGSSFAYQRLVGEVARFQGLSENLVLAARVRGGWLRPGEFRGLRDPVTGEASVIAHPQTRFFAGGANSVRGHAQNQLGPKVVSVDVQRLVLPDQEAGLPAVCAPEEVVDLTCDASSLPEHRFLPRPAGGSRLLEGSLELRFPIWGRDFRGAAFVDFGHVWEGNGRLRFDDLTVAPGFGLRYSTPVGPLRVDLAYQGRDVVQLAVVTDALEPGTADTPGAIEVREGEFWVPRGDLAILGPRVPFDDTGRSLLRRFQLHLSIGQAF